MPVKSGGGELYAGVVISLTIVRGQGVSFVPVGSMCVGVLHRASLWLVCAIKTRPHLALRCQHVRKVRAEPTITVNPMAPP